jgi:cobalt/nickel transport system permease protein
MTLPIALPVRMDAPLSRIDPRWKVAALVPAAGVVAGLRTSGPILAAVLGAGAVVLLARLPLRWYVRRLGTVVLGLALFLAFLPLVDHGDEERWGVGPVSVSPAGLALAAGLLAKAVALVSLLLAVATTAPMDVQLKALHGLGVPGLVVQLVALTARYLTVLLEEFATIRIALRVRGYRQRATVTSLRTVGYVAGMLLVRATERADRVAWALRCRGFDGRFHALTQFRTRLVDVVFWAVVVGTAAGLLVWDVGRNW